MPASREFIAFPDDAPERQRAEPRMALPWCIVAGAALRSLSSVALSSAPASISLAQLRGNRHGRFAIQHVAHLRDQVQARLVTQLRLG